MNSFEPIGGYYELELPPARRFLHDDGVLLNSGRACFEYILRAKHTTKVYMPKFTCDVMLEPLKRLGIEYEFYAIDNNLKITSLPDVQTSELLIYTNYFGIMHAYSRELSERYGDRLVLDYSQAWYDEPPTGSPVFYSPRKFFGLPDGGVLIAADLKLQEELPTDTSYERCAHLLKRIDLGAEAGYEDFKVDDAALGNVALSRMSPLTRRLLGSIDMAAACSQRAVNFVYLHECLSDKNLLRIDDAQFPGPLCYPYRTNDADLRKRLIDQKIFVATYWPNVLEWCSPDDTEYALARSILPIPIDQRYGKQEMNRILGVING